MAEKYTTELMLAVINEAEGNITAASKLLKCAPSTIRRYAGKYKAVKDAIKSFKGKKKLGPEEKYTQEQMIEAIYEAKGIIAVAARKLKCTRQTVYSYKEMYPEIQVAYNDINEETKDRVENQLLIHIFGLKDEQKKYIILPNLTAAIFYAKTKMKDRGYIEHTTLGLTDPTGEKEYGSDIRNIILGKLLPGLTLDGEEG